MRQLFAADHLSRQYFQMHFLLGDLRVNILARYLLYGIGAGNPGPEFIKTFFHAQLN